MGLRIWTMPKGGTPLNFTHSTKTTTPIVGTRENMIPNFKEKSNYTIKIKKKIWKADYKMLFGLYQK